jgi:hypothetical protein
MMPSGRLPRNDAKRQVAAKPSRETGWAFFVSIFYFFPAFP